MSVARRERGGRGRSEEQGAVAVLKRGMFVPVTKNICRRSILSCCCCCAFVPRGGTFRCVRGKERKEKKEAVDGLLEQKAGGHESPISGVGSTSTVVT